MRVQGLTVSCARDTQQAHVEVGDSQICAQLRFLWSFKTVFPLSSSQHLLLFEGPMMTAVCPFPMPNLGTNIRMRRPRIDGSGGASTGL